MMSITNSTLLSLLTSSKFTIELNTPATITERQVEVMSSVLITDHLRQQP